MRMPPCCLWWENRTVWLTLALSLVHDLQVRVSHAAGQQHGTLILVRLSIAATHSMLPGNVRAVWRAHTLRPSRLHLANLPRTASDPLAGLYKSTASAAQCQCNVTVLTSRQTSGDPQAFSYKTSLRNLGLFPDCNTFFLPCTIFTIIT